jgi:hypothetical protein
VPWPGAIQKGRGGPQAMNYIRHLNVFLWIVEKDSSLSSAHISLYMALFQFWNYNRFQNPYPVNRERLMHFAKIGSKNTYHKCLSDLHIRGYIFYHSGASKFEKSKITMVRLDEKREKSASTQLDIFSLAGDSPCPENETIPCTKNDTVPCLKNDTPPCIKNGTVPVPKMIHVSVPNSVHIYKLNNKTINSVCNTPTKIFDKNQLLNAEIGAVIQDAPPPKIQQEKAASPPSLSDVQDFFNKHNFPGDEAQKFFLYNEGKGWMFSPQLKIQNWQSLARKWMLNSNGIKSSGTVNLQIKVNNDKDYGEPL